MKEHFLSELVKKESQKKTKVTLYIPSDLLKSIKHFCVDNDLTLSEFFEKASAEFLDKFAELHDKKN
ncbi:MAG: hypothetical protein QXQ77_02415 [Candidatus Aenigmatarchaeota archaeon]